MKKIDMLVVALSLLMPLKTGVKGMWKKGILHLVVVDGMLEKGILILSVAEGVQNTGIIVLSMVEGVQKKDILFLVVVKWVLKKISYSYMLIVEGLHDNLHSLLMQE